MKIMSVLISSSSTLVQSQILSAPEGLNRIVDLLQEDGGMIRNEAILFCTVLAKTSAGSDRLMIFQEGFEKVLNIATSDNPRKTNSQVLPRSSPSYYMYLYNFIIEF